MSLCMWPSGTQYQTQQVIYKATLRLVIMIEKNGADKREAHVSLLTSYKSWDLALYCIIILNKYGAYTFNI